MPGYALEPVGLALRESHRQIPLVFSQDVDSIIGTRPELVQRTGAVIDADQYERGIARH
jgi:hypothetical protein